MHTCGEKNLLFCDNFKLLKINFLGFKITSRFRCSKVQHLV